MCWPKMCPLCPGNISSVLICLYYIHQYVFMKFTNVSLWNSGRLSFSSNKCWNIAAILTRARTWKQPKCPLTSEWIKNMWYTGTNITVIRRNEIGSFLVMWMNLESVTLSEVSQRQKNKYCVLTHVHGT